MRDILEKITSEDVDVLEQSLGFVKERAARESERGKGAEARATAMLAILGVLAGFIVPLVESIDTAAGDMKWSLIVTFFGSLIFLLKGLFYAVRVLGVSKQYRLQVDAVFEFQSLSRVHALREEIAGLVWECQKATQPNTEKLFWLHRSQRSGSIAIVLFMIFGVLLLAAEQSSFSVPSCAAYVIGVLVLLLLLLADKLAEKLGIWG